MNPEETYLNPVHGRPCPDPFVLKHRGEYWCYCTGNWHDGRRFGILYSHDLVLWREMAGALDPLEGNFPEYWAPEVIYRDGRFYMYYSVGDGFDMHIRVAVAELPSGPFTDAGRRLTAEPFAIDGHVFLDDDGAEYLFYATDFLDRSHIGTGTVVDRMLDRFTLQGDPRPVALPRFDWQVFDPRRIEKGGVRWHTVEGPFVLKHKDLYYQMFSGGNWQNTSYGVSYACASALPGLEEWTQIEHTGRTPLVLRTIPGVVIGPGHNSVVAGPDNVQLFCIYHRWSEDASARVLAIDRLDWIGERLAVLGPTTVAQPIPAKPSIAGLSPDYGWQWPAEGWKILDADSVRSSVNASGAGVLTLSPPACVVEVSVTDSGGSGEGEFGLALNRGDTAVMNCTFFSKSRNIRISWVETDNSSEYYKVDLPQGFDITACHTVRLELDGCHVRVGLDGIQRWQGRLSLEPDRLLLFAKTRAVKFEGFALTPGWRDLFLETDPDPALLKWRLPEFTEGPGSWTVAQKQLQCRTLSESIIAKEYFFESYELVLNARLVTAESAEGCYGLLPALAADGSGPEFAVERHGERSRLVCRTGTISAFDLPDGFDPFQFQQFRFRKRGNKLVVQNESSVLGEITVTPAATRVGLIARRAAVAFDEVRVTALAPKARQD